MDLGTVGYVMTEQAFAILLAAAFTFGCAAIHEWREHARLLTPILASITTGLALLAGMMTLAQTDGPPPGDISKPAPHISYAQAASWHPEMRVAVDQEPSMVETRQVHSEK